MSGLSTRDIERKSKQKNKLWICYVLWNEPVRDSLLSMQMVNEMGLKFSDLLFGFCPRPKTESSGI
jgi:hypothetical protein